MTSPAPDGLVEECREWLAAHNGSWAIKGGPVAMPEALAAFVQKRVSEERENSIARLRALIATGQYGKPAEDALRVAIMVIEGVR